MESENFGAEVFIEELYKRLIRLVIFVDGRSSYWTHIGSKPKSLNVASWSDAYLDRSLKGCLAASGMHMVFSVMVPRWSMRPAKLLIRSPLALRLVAFLALAVAEGSVAATGEDRSARAASRSVSWNKSGASTWRRCHST